MKGFQNKKKYQKLSEIYFRSICEEPSNTRLFLVDIKYMRYFSLQ